MIECQLFQQKNICKSKTGRGPGVRRSKRPLSACHTRRKCSMETTQNLVKVEFGTKSDQ